MTEPVNKNCRSVRGALECLTVLTDVFDGGLLLADADGVILWGNGAFAELAGCAREALPGMAARVALPMRTPDGGLDESLARVAHPDGPAHIHFETRLGAGERSQTCHVDLYRVQDADGTVSAFGVFSGINHQRHVEALKRLQMAAMHAVSDAMAIADQEGRLLWANAAFEILTGYGQEDVAGMTLWGLLEADVDRETVSAARRALGDGQSWTEVVRAERRDGSSFMARNLVTPVLDEKARISHYILLKERVSDEVGERRQLRPPSPRLERAWVQSLLPSVVHDLVFRRTRHAGQPPRSVRWRRGFSLRSRLALSLALLTICSGFFFTFLLHLVHRVEHLREVQIRLSAVVDLAAFHLDGDAHALLREPADEGSEGHARIAAELSRLREVLPGVRYVYTWRQDPEGAARFVVDTGTDAAKRSRLGDPLEGPLARHPQDRWGAWLTASAPIHAADGRVDAMLTADLAAAEVMERVAHFLRLALLVSLGGVPVALALGWALGTHLVRPMRELAEGARQVADGDLHHVIEVRTRDEVGEVGTAFNHMVTRLLNSTQSLRHEVSRRRIAEQVVTSQNERLEDLVHERTRALEDEVEERRWTQRLLEKVQARTEAILASAADGIVTINTQGIIQDVNPAMTDMFGYSAEELVGENVKKLMPADIASEHDGYLANYFRSGRRQPARSMRDIEARHKDGRLVPLEATLSQTRVGGEQLVTAILRDVTERKEAEAAIARAEEQEAELGFRIQQELLLGEPPEDLAGMDIAGFMVPSQGVGGDFYGFFRHGPDCVDILVGDVMGKGTTAALTAAAVKSHFLEALVALPWGDGETPPPPRHIVAWVQRHLAPEFIKLETFVTLCYARFDLGCRRVTVVDCGHPPVLRLGPGMAEPVPLVGNNMPMGFVRSENLTELEAPLEPGNRFLLYSDGLTETRNAADVFYGEERLGEAFHEAPADSAARLLEVLRHDVLRYSEGFGSADDMTCIAVVTGTGATEDVMEEHIVFMSDMRRLGEVRAFVREFCGRVEPPLTEEDRDTVELAVVEGVTNIIRHAYGEREDGRVELSLRWEERALQVRVFDWGITFELNAMAIPAFDGSQEGGFGLFIIHSLMDEVSYERDANGMNCLHMRKAFG